MPPRRVIGVDAGGTKLLGGVVDETLVVHHRVHRTWRGADRSETLDIVAGAVEEIRRAAPDVEAVGFGIPSLVDAGRRVSVWSNHLPIDGLQFADLMSERLGLPVIVDNDANMAVVAEHRFGAAKGFQDAVMIALGTGVGGGIVIGGRLHRGAHGYAGELGHLVLDIHGEDCPGGCPGRGCLEVLASGRAIGIAGERYARERPGSTLGHRLDEEGEIRGGLVTELAHDGDPDAVEILAWVGRRLGAGIAGIVNALDPEVVVIGGGAVAGGQLLLEPARVEAAARVLPPHEDLLRIVPAAFGEESGMLGAAVAAIELAGAS